MRSAATIVLVTCIGCGQSNRPAAVAPPVYDRLGSFVHAAPPGTYPPDTRPPPITEAPPELRMLAAATAQLHVQRDRDHSAIVNALRVLADALPMVIDLSDLEVVRVIRNAADTLATSHDGLEIDADQVRIALDAARVALARGESRSRWRYEEYVDALGAFTEISTSIDHELPLLPQHELVADAFVALVRLFEVALGVSSGLDDELNARVPSAI